MVGWGGRSVTQRLQCCSNRHRWIFGTLFRLSCSALPHITDEQRLHPELSHLQTESVPHKTMLPSVIDAALNWIITCPMRWWRLLRDAGSYSCDSYEHLKPTMWNRITTYEHMTAVEELLTIRTVIAPQRRRWARHRSGQSIETIGFEN